MTVIDRYIVRTFVVGYLILVGVGVGMYVLIDLLINLDDFLEDRTLTGLQVLGLMFDFYGHNLPLYYAQLGGPMMAVAAAFTLGRMLKNNELTALVAAGMPLQRLVVPLLLSSFGLTALWMANRECVMPAFAAQIARRHEDASGARPLGVYCARDEHRAILTALQVFPREGLLRRVFIFEPPVEGKPTHLLEADEARWDAARRTWRLERGRRILMGEATDGPGVGQAIRYEPVDEYAFGLGPEELALRRGSQWADLLSLRQLNQLMRSHSLPNLATIDMARHIRLTHPLLQWLLLLLAVPFFLTCQPANVLAAGGRALLLTGSFYLILFVAHSAVQEGTKAAIIAWIPLLIFGPIAAVQLSNIRT